MCLSSEDMNQRLVNRVTRLERILGTPEQESLVERLARAEERGRKWQEQMIDALTSAGNEQKPNESKAEWFARGLGMDYQDFKKIFLDAARRWPDEH